MRSGGSPVHCCDFCARALAEVKLMLRSALGGMGPSICDICARQFVVIADADETDPEAAAQAVANINALVERGRRA